MSLANVLAVSQAAKTVVLLGDPRQLDQPTQGTHPDGVDTSALDHMLAGHQTIPEDRGLFLEETWRLHPRICAFTSELFYEGRLNPRQGLELQKVRSTSALDGSGLRYLPVAHTGNQSSSPEEAEVIGGLVSDLLASNPTWIDRKGLELPLTLANIPILRAAQCTGLRIADPRLPGTLGLEDVDKFQETGSAAGSLFDRATSSPCRCTARDGISLQSGTELNRRRFPRPMPLSFLVASPMVFAADCRTPEQMRLANASCRYLELAQQPALRSLGESAVPGVFEDAA